MVLSEIDQVIPDEATIADTINKTLCQHHKEIKT